MRTKPTKRTTLRTIRRYGWLPDLPDQRAFRYAASWRVLGGHAVMAVGNDDALQCFIVRNSWNAKWGKLGYRFMPYAYFTSAGLASDFWTIRMVDV